MKVEMTFNDVAVRNNGYTLGDIYYTIQSAFAKRGITCSSESEVLTFEGTGSERDFANIGNLLLDLLKADWFIKCASSCVLFDDDDTEEDVLSQSTEIRKMLA